MNKTDMSNPDQCCLSGSLCCTKEADKLRHAMKGWVEMSGREARERGGGGEGRGGRKRTRVKIYSGAVSRDRAWVL